MKVAATIYSMMNRVREDYFGTLQAFADIGVQYIEYVATPLDADNRPIHTAREIGTRVDDLGLIPISSHVHFDAHRDAMKRTIEMNLEMRAPRLVLPFATMRSLEEIKRLSETCNTMGDLCQTYGLEFYYHNHIQEFVEVEGALALEHFLQYTEPHLVKVQVDTYWAMRSGVDPINLLKTLGPQCDVIHQKDLSNHADPVNVLECLESPCDIEAFRSLRTKGYVKPNDIVAVGDGILDVRAILQTAHVVNQARYVIVELDNMNDIAAIERSMRYLEQTLQTLTH